MIARILRALPIAAGSLLLAVAARAQDVAAKVQAGDELPKNAPNGVSDVAHHAASPVPQFDPSSFPGQLFWLAITFTLLYLAMSKLVLPRIGSVIGAREGHIAQDLAQAQESRAAAGALLAQHETAMKAARESAQSAVSIAQAAIARQQAEQLAAQSTQLDAQVAAAEGRIAAATAAAQAGLATAVADAAQAITARIANLTVDRAAAEAAAKTALHSKAA